MCRFKQDKKTAPTIKPRLSFVIQLYFRESIILVHRRNTFLKKLLNDTISGQNYYFIGLTFQTLFPNFYRFPHRRGLHKL